MVSMRPVPVLSDRIIEMARAEFPDAELGTALWLLRECEEDQERIAALLDADGDLMTLVLAVEDRLTRRASDHRR
jgi:hypothetical protein